MHIQSISFYRGNIESNTTSFHSVYPVSYFVSDMTKHYEPVVTNERIRQLNRQLVHILNERFSKIKERFDYIQRQIASLTSKLGEETDKRTQQKYVRQIKRLDEELQEIRLVDSFRRKVASQDNDYARCPYVRSFYNDKAGLQHGNSEPMIYLMTGQDAVNFENNYGKPIGYMKGKQHTKKSAELQEAKGNYWAVGLNYAKRRSQQYRNKAGLPSELCVYMDTVRAQNGEVKKYNINRLEYNPVETSKT